MDTKEDCHVCQHHHRPNQLALSKNSQNWSITSAKCGHSDHVVPGRKESPLVHVNKLFAFFIQAKSTHCVVRTLSWCFSVVSSCTPLVPGFLWNACPVCVQGTLWLNHPQKSLVGIPAAKCQEGQNNQSTKQQRNLSEEA